MSDVVFNEKLRIHILIVKIGFEFEPKMKESKNPTLKMG